jgi:hypothetical protein
MAYNKKVTPDGWEVVGRDGELVLYASPDHTKGLLFNEITKEMGDEEPLQVFFKWGNFTEIED